MLEQAFPCMLLEYLFKSVVKLTFSTSDSLLRTAIHNVPVLRMTMLPSGRKHTLKKQPISVCVCDRHIITGWLTMCDMWRMPIVPVDLSGVWFHSSKTAKMKCLNDIKSDRCLKYITRRYNNVVVNVRFINFDGGRLKGSLFSFVFFYVTTSNIEQQRYSVFAHLTGQKIWALNS